MEKINFMLISLEIVFSEKNEIEPYYHQIDD